VRRKRRDGRVATGEEEREEEEEPRTTTTARSAVHARRQACEDCGTSTQLVVAPDALVVVHLAALVRPGPPSPRPRLVHHRPGPAAPRSIPTRLVPDPRRLVAAGPGGVGGGRRVEPSSSNTAPLDRQGPGRPRTRRGRHHGRRLRCWAEYDGPQARSTVAASASSSRGRRPQRRVGSSCRHQDAQPALEPGTSFAALLVDSAPHQGRDRRPEGGSTSSSASRFPTPSSSTRAELTLPLHPSQRQERDDARKRHDREKKREQLAKSSLGQFGFTISAPGISRYGTGKGGLDVKPKLEYGAGAAAAAAAAEAPQIWTPDERCSDEQLAVLEQVRTGGNVFFTGSAGVGKSFLLQEITRLLEHLQRPYQVTATTGIAALQVSGITVHSWAGVGLAKDVRPPLSLYLADACLRSIKLTLAPSCRRSRRCTARSPSRPRRRRRGATRRCSSSTRSR